jgi:hypothetical protein
MRWPPGHLQWGFYLSGGQQTMMKTPLEFFANELAPSGS